ncbi:adenosylcobinamide-GDP ribazoletransferase [Undibacterium griseum]|uniref:Adenosylcobinamide-GDP ribazoletransferase n=1 Tax=Undibacterium griseum TaxID=2762295 RepID=A0ABR6YRT0_9BURK|nr:adenosylcobinamide-GDP ribazoletransferase [Undibacterium griseum]MBC3886596.1 adenosylcobinamide-GDP ribazoletransferase [Undibacterium griseum]
MNAFTHITQLTLHQLRLFFIAVQFFTRIPVPRWVGYDPDWLQQASRYFPAVGWLVGAVVSCVYIFAVQWWPAAVAVLLSMIAGLLLTGAFHEDGFADVCDGMGGGLTAERTLEIMKDSRIGAYGAIGIGMMLLSKFILLVSLPVVLVVPALLIAHPLSRLFSCSLIWLLEYARAEGKAKPLAQHMSSNEFGIACLSVLVPAGVILLCEPLVLERLIAALMLMSLAAFWMARLFVRKIGGYTGDCLGAVQQVTEVVFYLGLLAHAAK